MTIGFFLACIIGSAIGTVFVLAVALAILFWLDEPMRKHPDRGEPDWLTDKPSWLRQMDGQGN